MPRTSWTAKKSIETVLREADTTRSLINAKESFRIFFGHVMKREKLEHLVTTGKRSRGKQREKMLDGLTKWLNVGRMTDALKAKSDRDAWKVVIAYAKEQIEGIINT